MKKRRKGFTLIELLAVIVILGLLMAIAIPSVTKYITQSRKKTLTNTISNYMTALTNQVNDMEYIFTETNTIYAVPIECISLERGGTNPFGEWYQASNSYWAYVLVQYDDSTSSYTYGFTFKDSAGYGLYPTTSEKIKESGSQINTDLSLTRPTSGSITNITAKDNWLGFDLEDDTNLVVLEATSEGETGDGQTTCTLCQKGTNYDTIEQEKKMKLSNLIKEHNTIITASPTLTTSSNNSSDASGLYISNETNNRQSTYYFRGKVTNNYVNFAGYTWRIIRINEDGSIRIILNTIPIRYSFNSEMLDYNDMYYSNSDGVRVKLENWYSSKLEKYDSYISTGVFCEQAKVKLADYRVCGNASMVLYSDYTPNFRCSIDGNGKGIVNSKIGLITYDELVFAGGYYSEKTNDNIAIGSENTYTMSAAGEYKPYFSEVYSYNSNGIALCSGACPSRPVINLNANVLATGTGTSSDPYVIQAN